MRPATTASLHTGLLTLPATQPDDAALDRARMAAATAAVKSRLYVSLQARHDSAEDFSRLKAPCCTAMDWIFIPAYCFAIP